MDGIIKVEHWNMNDPSNGCVQVFRNGIIEVIAHDITFLHPDDLEKRPYFRTHHVNYIKQRLPDYLNAQKSLGIPLPVWCFLTLTGMKGVRINVKNNFNPAPPIDRDVLWLPEIEIMDYAADPLTTMRPLFDIIWNSGGYPKWLAFNDQGEWIH